MLEVNDFNAVRISLASPEQIKSWSYGEVTKPETINYRTLKPEKDGLFCERIFGPTKDWECYCGKYKRVRYKGIICDKCGVEVARAKVRRERMGHIDLAAPVSHIWFVKGTPSRVGLLLDLSPRSLERVLYFAQYIITSVDEQAKQEALSQVMYDLSNQQNRIEKNTQEQIDRLNQELVERIAELEHRRASIRQELQDKLVASTETMMNEATAVQSKMQEFLGQSTSEELRFGDAILAEQGSLITKDHLQRLKETIRERIEQIERQIQDELENNVALIDAEIDQLRYATSQEIDALNSKMQEDLTSLQETAEDQKREITSLIKLQLLSENQYHELSERCSHIFKAGMGAEAIHDILCSLDLNAMAEEARKEIRFSSGSGQRRKKAIKRLRVIEAFRKSGNRPEWMVLTVLPVLPPDLRPMVQLDGGRFATSDLNDLYRRVINRNNRLKRLLELGAPEIIIRNEKRMLQEAVDSLIDNGRRGRAVSGASNHKLKSLSDMLSGKQGRFRQNLLGKRVDYSARSVIVVGPELKLHQCGLPKRMALELFKPFVMRRLVENGFAHNIKSAKRIVERVRPEVWDILEEAIKDHPVLLNRAPTLHRLGIQAFEPILVEGSAVRIHPLVCAAFGADFDGDQMAVHVPLSTAAKREAYELMLSRQNLLSPSSGEPIMAPTLDMVLGCYYMTIIKAGAKGEGKFFSSPEEARLAYDLGIIDLQAAIKVRMPSAETDKTEIITTSIGRIIFNEILPPRLRFKNETMDRKTLRATIAECYRIYGTERTAELLDDIKQMGFQFATKSGITIAISDIKIPEKRAELLKQADARIAEIEKQYRRGLITDDERYNQAVEVWTRTMEQMTEAVAESLDRFGSIYMMTSSGAKGNVQQLRQMAAFRGLMSAPSGKIIELPVRSSFREGLSVLEYFISTHGARKGLADTAIRTADSGYLTRRLIDVAQDVVIWEEDCGTTSGVWIEERPGQGIIEPFTDRILGRLAASRIIHPTTGKVIIEQNEEIDEDKVAEIAKANIKRVLVRSPLSCGAKHGICRKCYGRSPATGRLVDPGQAVGIIAAQSIGEPGTQLTMRTFHTGGVAGVDITSGLPRVEELFEARVPKGQSIISEIDGIVEIQRSEDTRKIRIVSSQVYTDELPLPTGCELLANADDWVEIGAVLARTESEEICATLSGNVLIEDNKIIIRYEDREEREYVVPPTARLKVEPGQYVAAGDTLTEGIANPQDILRILGREAVEMYLVEEVQKVYRSQGVTIHDKHIEIIVRQMLRKVRIDTPGDTELLPGELVDRFTYEDINAKVLAEGGEPATAQTVLLGVTKASLNTSSFLAAASFQETTRVLTEAAIQGNIDHLRGLKENVIIGKLIPAGTGYKKTEALDSEKAIKALWGTPQIEGDHEPERPAD
ncbi:MAG: DNA-directed RNA polymerase subunit beta' [Chloroflexi bacterium]|nr:DNA-directed RNA polymerase subunit beta' [Chloroflexota bacterium]MCL5074260.1 DNA-directed RNA polymerase subunit beta' [Chloroflexota bacterium]